jgi:hypothetical protein
MNSERQIFRQNLKFAPYFGSVGGLLAVILGFSTPLYISFLILAAVVGVISFLIAWFGVRHRMNLNIVPLMLTIFSFMVGRDILLPRDMPHGISFCCELQALGVWMFVLGALHFAFHEKLKRDLENGDA